MHGRTADGSECNTLGCAGYCWRGGLSTADGENKFDFELK